MREMVKLFLNKSDPRNKRNKKTQCQNATCEQKIIGEKLKFGSN